MSWSLTGEYVETCSCELMCPCNLSLDHGATYDFCRVTLVFNIREGAVEGTDIAGCKVALIADTPVDIVDVTDPTNPVLAATIAEECFEDLDAPVKRIAAPDTPVPFSPVLEKAFIPQVDDVVAGLRELAEY